ncbi:uncharacterized protein LOC119955058 [Scyliorhinus canicula]|uniref:uncharacterized protein LOC119955058 n=1 Tax=Scyliorhinus canicula TaxID=7830 RepID=UPI0018F7CAAD|nr:uncharacterized protein LOC119955058 [Scyliorhinus canicula]
MGSDQEFEGRLSIVHDRGFYLIIHNVTEADGGVYTCSNRKQTRKNSRLWVKENCTMFDFFPRNSTKKQESDGRNGLLTLNACADDDVWIPCGLPGAGPYRWQWGRTPSDQPSASGLLDQVFLRRGYGVSLVRGASLVIIRLRHRDAGPYVCRVDGVEYKVTLRVVRLGLWEVLVRWWIVLVTVGCAIVLYTLVLGIFLKLRRKQKHEAHSKRISRMLSSFFRRASVSDTQFTGSYTNRVSTMGRGGTLSPSGSGSTSYENLGSREGDSGADGHSQTNQLEDEQDVGISYENLCTETEQEVDDYMDPDVDTASNNADDYMDPDVDTASNNADDYMDPDVDTASNNADDYMDPDVDTASNNADDYMEPDGKSGDEHETSEEIQHTAGSTSDRLKTGSLYAAPKRNTQQLDKGGGEKGWNSEKQKTRCHYSVPKQKPQSEEEENGEEGYAVPNANSPVKLHISPTSTYTNQTEMYEEMDRCQNTEQKSHCENQDYEKMEAARGSIQREQMPMVAETPEEEYMRMERCRNLFMMKFKLNASRYSREDDAAGSLKTPRRSHKAFETFGYPKRENVPE